MASKSGHKHPFGRENEVSVQLLFRSFCNHVCLGQWELAAGCVAELHSQKEVLGLDIRSVLSSIAQNSGTISIPSEAVPTTHHLAWLAVTENKKLLTEQGGPGPARDLITSLQENAEFRLLLFETCPDIEPDILQDVYQCFQATCRERNRSSPVSQENPCLLPKTLEYLSSKILSDPQTGHQLLLYLRCHTIDSLHTDSTNDTLIALELRCLTIMLTEIKHAFTHDSSELGSLTAKFVALLARFDPAKDAASSAVEDLFQNVVYFLNNRPIPQFLSRTGVISCLVGRQTSYLLETFFKVEGAGRSQHYWGENVDCVQGSTSDRLSTGQRNQLWLNLSRTECRQQAWRDMGLICQRMDKHFLESVVEVAMSFIQSGDVHKLEELFCPLELRPLKSVVLLLGWHFCMEVDTAEKVLNVLWDPQIKPVHESLCTACQRLSFQVQLTQWCLEKVRSLSGVSLSSGKSRIKSFFQGLELHSPLYLLHHSTSLSSLNTDEVISFLQDSPVHKASSRDRAPTKPATAVKQVHFAVDQPAANIHDTDTFSLEQAEDVNKYRAYCILFAFMEVITFCCDLINPWKSSTSLMQDSFLSSKTSSQDGMEDSCSVEYSAELQETVDSPMTIVEDLLLKSTKNMDIKKRVEDDRLKFRELYRTRVLARIEEAKSHLSQLFPLNYRLEVLENVFSLLFLTHEDLAGDSHKMQDSGEEGAIEDQSLIDESSHNLQPSVCDEACVKATVGVDTKEETLVKSEEDVPDEARVLENFSTDTTHSLLSSSQSVGFLVSEFVLRDVLLSLRESLVELGSLHQVFSSNRDVSSTGKFAYTPSQNALLMGVMKCGIANDQIPQHRSQLSQYISEALWRFQLVAEDWIPRDFGKLPEANLDVQSCSVEDVDIQKILGDELGRFKDNPSSPQQGSSLSEDNQNTLVSLATTDGSQSGASVCSSSSRRRRRKHRKERRLRRGPKSRSAGLMPRMLSDEHSLLNVCLCQGKFSQAMQVAKLFNMEKVQKAKEAKFAEQFQAAVKRMRSQDITTSTSSDVSSSKRLQSLRGKTSLSAIASVAAAGITSVSTSNVVDQILGLAEHPNFDLKSLIDVNQSGATNLEKLGLLFLDPSSVVSMIVIDLACVACNNWDKTRSLVNMAEKRLQGPRETDTSPIMSNQQQPSSKQRLSIELLPNGDFGYSDFLQRLVATVGLGINANETTTSFFRRSSTNILTTASVPMDTSDLRRYANGMVTLHKELKHVRKILKENCVWPSRLTRPQPDPTKGLSTTGIKVLLGALHNNIPQGGWAKYLLKLEPAPRDCSYVQGMLDHVTTLAETISRLATDSSHSVLQESFSILRQSPADLLGALIFRDLVEPSSLESVCRVLHIDLPHAILKACCPSVPSHGSMDRPRGPGSLSGTGSDRHGQVIEGSLDLLTPQHSGPNCTDVVVLNETKRSTPRKLQKDPELAVRLILVELTKLMKDTIKSMGIQYFTKAAAKSLLKSGQVMQCLQKTGWLRGIDLAGLATDEQKLCFHGNLMVLMRIHMWLHLLDTAVNKSNSKENLTSDTISTLILENKMAYNIGQLGTVSYFDLRHQIGRLGFFTPSNVNGTVHRKIPEIDSDDPWCIYGYHGDYAISFVIADGTYTSPILQVLHPELVRHQLRVGTELYLRNSTQLDVANKTIRVPLLLLSLLRDSTSGGEAFCSILSQTFPEEARSDVLKSLLEYRQDAKTRYTVQMLEPPSGTNTPLYTFCADTWQTLQHSRLYSRQRRDSYPSVSSPANTDLRQDLPTHCTHLYPVSNSALSYLASSSELLTTVALVTCSDHRDDQVMAKFSEDHFPAQTPPAGKYGTKSPLSLEKPSKLRELQHQMLGRKYPLLSRYLWVNSLPLLAEHKSECPNIFEDDPNHPLQRVPTDLTLLNQDLRAELLRSSSSSLRLAVLKQTASMLLKEEKWDDLEMFFNLIPCDVLQLKHMSDLRILHDYSMCCILNSRISGWSSDCAQFFKDWSVILKLCDSDLKSRLVLGTLKYWDVGVCLQLLQACVQREVAGRASTSAIQTLVVQRLAEMKVYGKITCCAKTILSQLHQPHPFCISGKFNQSDDSFADVTMETEDWTNQMLRKMSRWQDLVTISTQSPEVVLEVITHIKDFETAYSWAKIYKVYDRFELVLKEVHVTSLLEKPSSEKTEAFQVLDELRLCDADRCFQVCSSLLDKLSSKEHILFVARFVVCQLRAELGEWRLDALTKLCVGCKGLLTLPNKDQADYEHLVSEPELLFEQILMNNKVPWAKDMLGAFEAELKEHPAGQANFSREECDRLLESYAREALDFPLPEVLGSPGSDPSSRALSRPSSMLSLTGPSPRLHKRHGTMSSLTGIAPGSGQLRSATLSSLVHSGAAPAVGSLPIQPSRPPHGSLHNLSDSSVPGSHSVPVKRNIPFVMPAEPPDKSAWVPDAAVTVCMVCSVEHFSMFNRRHHCRRCGRVVCGTCSQHSTMVLGQSARTCDQCYRQIFPPKSVKEPSDIQRLRERLSTMDPGSGPRPSLSPPLHGNISIQLGSPSSGEHTPGSGTQVLDRGEMCTEFVYLLSLDKELNALTRDEFYYDHAPSTALCLAILDLHSSPATCARVLLDLCDMVSRQLQPLAPGVRNPEVDYGLVITMLKSMLMTAKVKFLRAEDSSGISQCGLYMDRVNLLDLLATNNCTYLPSLIQLTKPDTLRRLRDRLIEEERFRVAMEVSTKCGLEPLGVWTSWGLACLRVGDLPSARDKFAKCLKPPVDKNQVQLSSSQKIVSDIISCLENFSSGGISKFLASVNSINMIKMILTDLKQRPADEVLLDDTHRQECLYYLRTYGTHISVVAFYRRHRLLCKATHYILDQKCSTDVFLEGLFLPAVSGGSVGQLLEQLRLVDPSLCKWLTYLTATCKHLSQKSRQMNVLYQIQLFMKDYLRAAMMCINEFYLLAASDYVSLHSRVSALLSARRHMDAYLADHQWGTRSRHTSGDPPADNSLRMILSPGEVNKYIHNIEVQVEVTKFLYQYHDNYEALLDSMATVGMSEAFSQTRLPIPITGDVQTLFGSTRSQVCVACLVLLCGNNVHDGYGLAFRIIQNFKLDFASIYAHVGGLCAVMQQYDKIRQLLACVKESGLCTDTVYDEVIECSIEVMSRSPSEAKEVENLIKMLRSDTKKVKAFMKCGKLKSAYLLAVRLGSVDDVRVIHQRAKETGQTGVLAITEQYLQKLKH